MPRTFRARNRPATKHKIAPLELGLVEPAQTADHLAVDVSALADEAAARWRATLNTIREEFARGDPLKILLDAAMYLVASLAPVRPLGEAPPFQQHDAELLQAHALRFSRPEHHSASHSADVTHNILEAIKENQRAFAFKTLTPLPQEDRELWELMERLRVRTQCVRNEFEPADLEELLLSIAEQIDQPFEVLYGVKLTNFIQILKRSYDHIRNNIIDRKRSLYRVLKSGRPGRAIHEYVRAFPKDPINPSDLEAEIRSAGITPDKVGTYLFLRSERFLEDVFTFTTDDVLGSTGVETIEATQLLLRRISIGFGDLENNEVEHIYLANPIWRCPLVDLGDGRFLWPIPGLLYSFGLDIIESLCAPSPHLIKSFEKARSITLEKKLFSELRKAFPSGRILENAQWKNSEGQQFETDAIVLLDRALLIFEAKSGKITPEARRGSKPRVKRELQKLLVDPSVQSNRLVQAIQSSENPFELHPEDGASVLVKQGDITYFGRFNVTLQTLSSLSSHWPTLRKAGVIGLDVPMAATLGIGDLMAAISLIPREVQRFHYLRRRLEIEEQFEYDADERDLLALYIDNCFNLPELDLSNTAIQLYGASEALWALIDDVGRMRQPDFKFTRLWSALLDGVEELKPQWWTEIAYTILLATPREQREVSSQFDQMLRQLSAYPDSKGVGLVVGPANERRTLAICVERGVPRHEFGEQMTRYAAETAQMASSEWSIAVGLKYTRPFAKLEFAGVARRR